MNTGLIAVALAVALSAQTQSELNRGAVDSLAHADKELNKVYNQLRTSPQLSAEQRRLLATSERAWISYRNAHCELVTSSGGSVMGMIGPMCWEELTRERTKLLKSLMNGPEGCLDCLTTKDD